MSQMSQTAAAPTAGALTYEERLEALRARIDQLDEQIQELINQRAARVLIGLRKPGDSHSSIPRGGMYRFVSCPNYFGEILEWAGWAVMTWSLAGLAFAVFTVANLLPRALARAGLAVAEGSGLVGLALFLVLLGATVVLALRAVARDGSVQMLVSLTAMPIRVEVTASSLSP